MISFQVSVLNLRHRNYILAEEYDDNCHIALVSVLEPIARFPSHLLFNISFTEFLHGGFMLPLNPIRAFTNRNTFEGMCLPEFNVKIKIEKITHGSWNLAYACNCSNPLSLMCMSRLHVIVKRWTEMLKTVVEEAERNEPDPPVFITNFNNITHNWMRLPIEQVNPVSSFHHLFAMYYDNFAVGRTVRNGLVYYYVYVRASVMDLESRHVMQCLMSNLRKLPFYISLDYFPIYRIDYDIVNESDSLV